MPEWYFVLAALSGLTALGVAWAPLLYTLPVLAIALAASLAQAALGAARARYRNLPASWYGRQQLRMTTAFLHLVQPLARLVGRIRHGLTPWRSRATAVTRLPRRREMARLVSGVWESSEDKLVALEGSLRRAGAVVRRGSEFSRWDLELSGGLLAGARVLLSVEDLCPGKQLVRFRSWPWLERWGLVLCAFLLVLSAAATADRAFGVGGVLGLACAAILLRAVREAAYSQSTLQRLLSREPESPRDLTPMLVRSDAE
jgi:hypothetical protein